MKTELATTLKRQATRILSDVRNTHDPVLITEHGKPSAYLVDVDTFVMRGERLLRNFLLEERNKKSGNFERL